MSTSQLEDHKKNFIQAAQVFANYMISQYPQIGDDKLNYYISGSLALALLGSAISISVIDEKKLPRVHEDGQHISAPSKVLEEIHNWMRPLGDVDVILMDHYKKERKKYNLLYRESHTEDARKARDRFLHKGGNGPFVKNYPQDVKDAILHLFEPYLFEDGLNRKIAYDPVKVYGDNNLVLKIETPYGVYYIASPIQMLAYKMLHLIQNPRKSKSADDLATLYRISKSMFPREINTAAKIAYDSLSAYTSSARKWNPGFDPSGNISRVVEIYNNIEEIKKFLKQMKKYDEYGLIPEIQ